jgi:hypothetical protein
MSWQSTRCCPSAYRPSNQRPATSDQAPHRTAPQLPQRSQILDPYLSFVLSTTINLRTPPSSSSSPITHHQTYAASPSANRALCLLSTLPLSSRISRLLQIHPQARLPALTQIWRFMLQCASPSTSTTSGTTNAAAFFCSRSTPQPL